jgi:hypothetical protein
MEPKIIYQIGFSIPLLLKFETPLKYPQKCQPHDKKKSRKYIIQYKCQMKNINQNWENHHIHLEC